MCKILQFPNIYKNPNDPVEDIRRAQRVWEQEVVGPITEYASLEDEYLDGSRRKSLLEKIFGRDAD